MPFYNLSIKYTQLLRSVPFFICSVYVPHFASASHLIFIRFVVDVAYCSTNDIKALYVKHRVECLAWRLGRFVQLSVLSVT
jgi:hypothetical protein